MDDKTVIDLYWARSQEAITQTDRIYAHCAEKLPADFCAAVRMWKNV